MAPRGGYRKHVTGIEWAALPATADAEGKLAAAAMGQSYQVWLADAVAFHVYYCERFRLFQEYQHDQAEATSNNMPTVDQHDQRYQPRRERPTVTLQEETGAGTSSRRSPKP